MLRLHLLMQTCLYKGNYWVRFSTFDFYLSGCLCVFVSADSKCLHLKTRNAFNLPTRRWIKLLSCFSLFIKTYINTQERAPTNLNLPYSSCRVVQTAWGWQTASSTNCQHLPAKASGDSRHFLVNHFSCRDLVTHCRKIEHKHHSDVEMMVLARPCHQKWE